MSGLLFQLARRVLQPSAIRPRALSRFESMASTHPLHEQHTVQEAAPVTSPAGDDGEPPSRTPHVTPRQFPADRADEPLQPTDAPQAGESLPRQHSGREQQVVWPDGALSDPRQPAVTPLERATTEPAKAARPPLVERLSQNQPPPDSRPADLPENPAASAARPENHLMREEIVERSEQRLSRQELIRRSVERLVAVPPAAAPPAAPAPLPSRTETRAARAVSPSAPQVEIRIGRIEVRTAPAPLEQHPAPGPRRQESKGLEEYLRERSGRRGQGGLS